MEIILTMELFFHGSFQAEIAMGMSKDEQSFRNLSLSFRGSERQPPTVLQMALRFSKVMERQSSAMSGNTEARLRKVVTLFNQSKGLNVKHMLDQEKERTILNLICGTCKAGGLSVFLVLFFRVWLLLLGETIVFKVMSFRS